MAASAHTDLVALANSAKRQGNTARFRAAILNRMGDTARTSVPFILKASAVLLVLWTTALAFAPMGTLWEREIRGAMWLSFSVVVCMVVEAGADWCGARASKWRTMEQSAMRTANARAGEFVQSVLAPTMLPSVLGRTVVEYYALDARSS